MKYSKSVVLFVCIIAQFRFACAKTQRIVVGQTGKADFTSIQAAINSLPDTSKDAVVIFVRNGTYNEKLFITKSGFVLEGESREKTIVTQAIARDEWRCDHKEDWGVATVNMSGSDITLKNLTIINSYGFDNLSNRDVVCGTDSIKKTISKNGHQMAVRTFATTRLKVINCHIRSFAGDTMSPWNTSNGMFYFKDCTMEGGVDFYCPRGWAFAEHCTFIAHTGSASVWHDGSANEDAKTVLKDCVFQGFDGFNLGRYHKDAQFYLINCSFADNMANKDIYLVATTNNIQWGRRVYYYNCHRKKGDYTWFADNLSLAKGKPTGKEINTDWTFNNKWSITEN